MATPSTHLPSPRQPALRPPETEPQHSDPVEQPPPAAWIKDLDLAIQQTRLRLTQEIAGRRLRGDISFALGTIMVPIAIYILAFAFNSGPTSPIDYVVRLLLKLTLCGLTGGLSAIMFRLHSASQEAIKYFHNELTNIEQHLMSARLAILTNNNSAIAESLSVLARTERNPLMKKGETNNDLERAKIESQSFKDFLAKLSELLKQGK